MYARWAARSELVHMCANPQPAASSARSPESAGSFVPVQRGRVLCAVVWLPGLMSEMPARLRAGRLAGGCSRLGRVAVRPVPRGRRGGEPGDHVRDVVPAVAQPG